MIGIQLRLPVYPLPHLVHPEHGEAAPEEQLDWLKHDRTDRRARWASTEALARECRS